MCTHVQAKMKMLYTDKRLLNLRDKAVFYFVLFFALLQWDIKLYGMALDDMRRSRKR